MFTTVQKVRERASFQNYRIDAPLFATGNSVVWSNNVKDLEKFVPRISDGATLATLSDLNVKYNGLSVGFTALDRDSGNITLSTGYATGSSLVATYASSPITSNVVYEFISEAHSNVLSKVAVLYSVPIGVCIPMLANIETKIAAGNVLIGSYGIAGQDSSEDGYKMIEEANKTLQEIADGELQLIDIDGNPLPPDATGLAGGGNALGGQGVRVKGYLFTADEEDFDVISRDTYANQD